MIIGIDASRANKKQRSGVEWYSYHLIKQLYQLDKENRYFLYTPKPLLDELKPLPSNFQEKVLTWPINKFWTQGRLSLEMLVNKPDVLFIPAHVFPLILGKKNIISWPDVGHKHFPESYSQSQLLIIDHSLKRAALKAEKIITISGFSKDELVKYYQINPDKIVVTYLGYDKIFYPRNQQEVDRLRSKYQMVNDYLIYIGRLTKRKNLINLIEAYEQIKRQNIKKVDLVIVGNKERDSQEIFDRIAHSSFKESIKVLGYVPQDDLPILLSGASCLVHPSLFEGFGLTIIEAMACRCPVICSQAGSLPEVAQEAVIYFNPQDPLEISQKIISLLTNSQLKGQLIDQGLERVKNFSWERCAKETLRIFEQVTNDSLN